MNDPGSQSDGGRRRSAFRSLVHSPGRPWRTLGAVICGLATVMFILGVCLLDERRGRTGFLLFWFVELVLLLWLCALAAKDVRYTRRLAAEATLALLAELRARPAPDRLRPEVVDATATNPSETAADTVDGSDR